MTEPPNTHNTKTKTNTQSYAMSDILQQENALDNVGFLRYG